MIEIVIKLLSSLLIGVCIGQMYVLYRTVVRLRKGLPWLKNRLTGGLSKPRHVSRCNPER